MGFTRRYATMPSTDVLLEIEGTVIIDGVTAGPQPGVGTGVACIIGEFTDVTYGVAIDASGVVTTSPRPVEILGSDLESLMGGFDETLGEFGGDCGNGWMEAKNKRFSRLLAVPVNNASSQGVRLYRELPTNKSATDPTPVVEVVGATVTAGTEFKSSTNRVRLAQRVTFLGTSEYTRGVDGAITNAGGVAAFQNFVAAGGNFSLLVRDDGKVGVQVGDILVLGVIGGAGALGANANTYRVRAVTNGTTLVVEKLDASTFDWTTGTAQPWRLYTAAVADTGAANHVGTQAGYRVPARPLDATIAINLTLTPTISADPATPTADNWAPLSGMKMRSAPTTGIVYTATIQAPNAVNDATLDALYDLAIDALLDDSEPANEVTLVWAARKSTTIRDLLKTFVLKRKREGRGCLAHWSPALDNLSQTTVLGDTGVGVGAARARELIYNWPGVKTFVREAVGKSIKLATGELATDGVLDVTTDGFAVSVESVLQPERSPGEVTDTTQTALVGVMGYQSGITSLSRDFYKRARARGMMAIRIYRGASGQPVRAFQTQATTSLLAGEQKINVRRFSFYVQDSLVVIMDPFCKLPLDPETEDAAVSATDDFLGQLLADRRMKAYQIDAVGGNTASQRALGIFVIKHAVEMTPLGDVLVIDSRVGYNVLSVQGTTIEVPEAA